MYDPTNPMDDEKKPIRLDPLEDVDLILANWLKFNERMGCKRCVDRNDVDAVPVYPAMSYARIRGGADPATGNPYQPPERHDFRKVDHDCNKSLC